LSLGLRHIDLLVFMAPEQSGRTTRKRKPLRRRLAGHGRLGWEPDKAARPNSIDAVATLVAVSSSKPANALASLGPAEVSDP
jgi:hypothetical protein